MLFVYMLKFILYVCLSVCCCAVGTEDPTPENRTIINVIRTLFTPYLTKCISRVPINEVIPHPLHAHPTLIT